MYYVNKELNSVVRRTKVDSFYYIPNGHRFW